MTTKVNENYIYINMPAISLKYVIRFKPNILGSTRSYNLQSSFLFDYNILFRIELIPKNIYGWIYFCTQKKNYKYTPITCHMCMYGRTMDIHFTPYFQYSFCFKYFLHLVLKRKICIYITDHKGKKKIILFFMILRNNFINKISSKIRNTLFFEIYNLVLVKYIWRIGSYNFIGLFCGLTITRLYLELNLSLRTYVIVH